MYVDEFAALQTGFFRADTHEVAFHGRLERGFLCGRTGQHTVKGIDKTLVAAAVAVALFVQIRYANDFRRRRAEGTYGNRACKFVEY